MIPIMEGGGKNEREENEEEEEEDDEGGGEESKVSSNSTVEEIDKKTKVRPYMRSKVPRLRWTPDLHLRFVHAVERLGGQERATPKLVCQMMNIKGLSIAHVKSHLQMYRSKKMDDQGQAVADHRHFIDPTSTDRNIYKLSQLPMFRGYNINHNHDPPFRYGSKFSNASLWNSCSHETNRSLVDMPGLVSASSVSNNVRGSEYWTNNRSFQNIYSSSISNHLPKIRHNHQERTNLVTFNSIQGQSRTSEKFPFGIEESTNHAYCNKTTGKRNASTSIDLDLSLKLRVPEKTILEETETAATTMDQNLSLSLCSGSSSWKKSRVIKMDEEDRTVKIGQASTLDLTL